MPEKDLSESTTVEESVMEEVNGKIIQRGFLESYFQIAHKDLNQKPKMPKVRSDGCSQRFSSYRIG
mgnify:CR=1 FL=1